MVSNNKFWRGVSDKLDEKMGWEGERKDGSGARGILHGTYHGLVGTFRYATFDWERGRAEYNRAGNYFVFGVLKVLIKNEFNLLYSILLTFI